MTEHEAGKRFGDFAETPRQPEAQQPEPCAARKALEGLYNSCWDATDPDYGPDICEPDGNAMAEANAALASPCSCAALREPSGIDSGSPEAEARDRLAVLGFAETERRIERLRAELSAAKQQASDDAITMEYRSAVIETQNERAKRDEAERDSLRDELAKREGEIEQWHKAFAHAIMTSAEEAFTYVIGGKSIQQRAEEWFRAELAAANSEAERWRAAHDGILAEAARMVEEAQGEEPDE